MPVAILAAMHGEFSKYTRPRAVEGAAPLFILLRYHVDHLHRPPLTVFVSCLRASSSATTQLTYSLSKTFAFASQIRSILMDYKGAWLIDPYSSNAYCPIVEFVLADANVKLKLAFSFAPPPLSPNGKLFMAPQGPILHEIYRLFFGIRSSARITPCR